MTTSPDEKRSGKRTIVGEVLVIGARTLIPVISARTRFFGPTIVGNIYLEGLVIVESDSCYAPILPPGKSLDEFLCAVPGLQEQVERIRHTA